jgi:SagB-type dehydrogenase family enzyme
MEFAASKNFHRLSKIKKGENQPKIIPYEDWPRDWKEIEFKKYPRFEQIGLAKPDLPEVAFQKIIEERRSQREFSGGPVGMEDVSRLLFWSGGLIRVKDGDLHKSRRPYPSGGGRYPLEIYLAVLEENGELEKGLYHYNVAGHSLEKLAGGSFRRDLMAAVGQEMVEKAPLILMISAVFKRTQKKYRERGYRFVLMEAGHLGQNISLASAALGLKCCAIGGFDDDICSRLLYLNDEEESVVYLFALGH